MAWQVPGFLPGDLVAAEDLSSRQFRLVRMASDNAVELADTEGGFAIGILLNAPAAGAAAAVEMAGISRLVAGEARWGWVPSGHTHTHDGGCLDCDNGARGAAAHGNACGPPAPARRRTALAACCEHGDTSYSTRLSGLWPAL